MLKPLKRVLGKQSTHVMEKHIIYLYNDLGASAESIRHTVYTLKQVLPSKYKMHFINALEIQENKWSNHAALLIMPGGKDLQYAKQLNGKGNRAIKNYVKNGGNYLGICAGAYYGSKFVAFDRLGPLEVLEKRALAFFPNKAIGPILAQYHYNNNSGSRAARIQLVTNNHTSHFFKDIAIYYNGGPYFNAPQLYNNVKTLAYYQMAKYPDLAAMVKIKQAKGTVILSGVHFEYSSDLLDVGDTYHAQILPQLQKSEPNRLKLASFIFKQYYFTTHIPYQ